MSQIVKVIDPKNLESELKRAEPGALIDIEVTSAFGPQIDFFSKEFEEKEFFGALEKAIQQGFFFQLILEINAVNAVYISDFLNSIKTINPGKQHSIKIYFSLNRQDHALSLQALTPDLKSSLDTLLLFLKENSAYFSADNRQQVQDAVLFANQKRSQDEIIRLQKAFYEYTLEHQTNNGKLFSESFVKLADFWEHCSQFDPFITQKTNEATRIKLNKVSKSFCLAKWTTVSLHLESGTTHSCHHPGVHNIPLEEIAGNPSALHNTGYKIEQRKKMISGERPTECEYCWNIEDISPDTVSDRIIKSSAKYSLNQLDQIVSAPDSKRFNPRYVEVSFSNACQFKCSYCSANYSSSWAEELDKFGPYSTYSGQGHNKTFVEEENPYVRSFWDWWPDLKKDLHTFRITGGEPLLSSSTFKVLENLIEHPEPKLNLSINSNLGAPAVLIDKFINNVKKIFEIKALANLEIYTSIDAFGGRAEYIRNGLKADYFWQNIEKLLTEVPKLRIHIMCTFNALSITSFTDLLAKIRELNIKHRSIERVFPIDIDISYLRYPEYQTVRVLPGEYLKKMQTIVDYLEEFQWLKTNEKMGYLEYHILKAKRILEWMRVELPHDEKRKLQSRFYQFFSQHDERRHTDFLTAFPEMKDFWDLCKTVHEEEKIKSETFENQKVDSR